MSGQQQLDGFGSTLATLSEDRRYRFTLQRVWDHPASVVNFVGLNPSTADESVDDATVRRCMRFARDWGYGGLVMTNLYAFRATDPDDLAYVENPAGNPANDAAIREMAAAARLVVCAWGSNTGPLGTGRIKRALELLDGHELHAIRRNADGMPSHPLYLPARLTPQPWAP